MISRAKSRRCSLWNTPQIGREPSNLVATITSSKAGVFWAVAVMVNNASVTPSC